MPEVHLDHEIGSAGEHVGRGVAREGGERLVEGGGNDDAHVRPSVQTVQTGRRDGPAQPGAPRRSSAGMIRTANGSSTTSGSLPRARADS